MNLYLLVMDSAYNVSVYGVCCPEREIHFLVSFAVFMLEVICILMQVFFYYKH